MGTWAVDSPDGQVGIFGADGAPGYQVRHRGRTVVGPSRFGVVLAGGAFGDGLSLTGAGPIRTGTEAYEKLTGKQRSVRVSFRERTLRFDAPFEVDVRAYDEGVAFRYRLTGTGDVTIRRELTTVRPAGDGTVWQQPTQAPEEFGPAYENP
jgi:alpha-glucosidase